MSFTHINISHDTYAFSDFPLYPIYFLFPVANLFSSLVNDECNSPADAPDYVHHSTMSKYVNSFVDHFKVAHSLP
jgi:hypothetical protein